LDWSASLALLVWRGRGSDPCSGGCPVQSWVICGARAVCSVCGYPPVQGSCWLGPVPRHTCLALVAGCGSSPGLGQTYARRVLSARTGVAALCRWVEVTGTTLYGEERGDPSAFPLLVFHGAPGLDHTWFGDYLDPLTPRRTWRGGCPAPSSWCSRTPRT